MTRVTGETCTASIWLSLVLLSSLWASSEAHQRASRWAAVVAASSGSQPWKSRVSPSSGPSLVPFMGLEMALGMVLVLALGLALGIALIWDLTDEVPGLIDEVPGPGSTL